MLSGILQNLKNLAFPLDRIQESPQKGKIYGIGFR